MGSLNLTPKIIILLAVPLLLELALLGAIANLENEAENEAARALHATRLSKSFSQLTNDLFAFTANSYGEKALPRLASGDVLKTQTEKLDQDYDNLARSIGNNEKELAVLASSKANLKKAAQIVDECISSYLKDGESQRGYRRDLFRKVKDYAPLILSDEMTDLGLEYENLSAKGPEKQAEFRNQARSLILWGGAANVLLAVAVAAYLMRGVISRLKVMNENAHLLANEKPLHDTLPGHDEIAKLDQSFHELADALNQAKRVRQDLVAMITHDLRTPLSTVQGFLEMVEDGDLGELNASGKNLTTAAHYNCERMMALVDDFLDVERIRSGKMPFTPKPVLLGDVIQSACTGLTDWAKIKEIVINHSSEQITIQADQRKLVRVLTNLIANAVKHCPSGTTINVAGVARNSTAEISVQDNGTGIADADLQKIFDRFEQGTVERDSGSGLGLYICKALVELHAGSIAVKSGSTGTTFTVTLPLEPSAALPPGAAALD